MQRRAGYLPPFPAVSPRHRATSPPRLPYLLPALLPYLLPCLLPLLSGIDIKPLISAPLDMARQEGAADEPPVLYEAGSCEWRRLGAADG